MKRRAAAAAFALGCFGALLTVVLWVQVVHGGSGKAGWGWSLVFALVMALTTGLVFAIVLWLGTLSQHRLALRPVVGLGAAAVAGLGTPACVLLVKSLVQAVGIGDGLFTSPIGGFAVMLMLAVIAALGLAALSRRRARQLATQRSLGPRL